MASLLLPHLLFVYIPTSSRNICPAATWQHCSLPKPNKSTSPFNNGIIRWATITISHLKCSWFKVTMKTVAPFFLVWGSHRKHQQQVSKLFESRRQSKQRQSRSFPSLNIIVVHLWQPFWPLPSPPLTSSISNAPFPGSAPLKTPW